ncbi:MAG TPA: hypothetical protein PLY88_05730 [Candidatus Omnitrophota bacterium]|nr:hypothetical protein [Candidatus Omnitrophota bacterium]
MVGLPGWDEQEETSKQAIEMMKDLLKMFFDSIMGIKIIRFYAMILALHLIDARLWRNWQTHQT